VEPAPTSPRPKPLVAIVLVAVPLLAIIVGAVVTTTRSNEGAATATTISQAGDPAAAGRSSTTTASGSKATTTTTTKAGKAKEKGTTTSTAPKAAAEPETPSKAADAGPEGERASVTYPQPTVPASGCSRPSGTAVITLGSKPSPACLQLGADQAVVIRNRTGKEISFVAISVNEVIAAGSEMRIGTASSAFGDGRSTFWSPGNPQLSGIVIVG
jgi:hypothetical protein